MANFALDLDFFLFFFALEEISEGHINSVKADFIIICGCQSSATGKVKVSLDSLCIMHWGPEQNLCGSLLSSYDVLKND